MEKLEKALLKARAERMAAVAAAPPPVEPEPVAEGEVRHIIYQQTRSLAPDPAALRERRIVTAETRNKHADLFRVLRTKVLQQLDRAGQRTVAITSTMAGEGKSFVATNLALSIALDVRRTVLLVDADLRHPAIHRCFGIKPQLGLSDALQEKVPLPDCLCHVGFERLVVLPGGKPVEGSAEVLSGPHMQRLSRELHDRYSDRIVIYDLPPLFTTADALSFLPNVEASLLVVGEGMASAEDVQRATRMLAESTNFLGTVLNLSQERRATAA
jgi:protein-tyrosine kinase